MGIKSLFKAEKKEFIFDIGAAVDIAIKDDVIALDFDIQYENLEDEGMKSLLEEVNDSIPVIDLSKKIDITDFDFISKI